MIEQRDIKKLQSFAYLREQLEIGKTLSSSLSKLPLEKGRVFAFVPEGTSEDLLFSFESGGIYSYEEERKRKQIVVPIKNESRPLVMKEILTHLSSSSKNCCLFEEALAIPSDPWVAASNIKYVHLQSNEMFYFFDGNNKEQEINDSFKQSKSH